MIFIIKLAAGIVLARILWAFLPTILGMVVTAILAVLSPVTTLHYLLAKKAAPAAPPAPFNAKECVERHFENFKASESR
jgi:hypothetical protein